MPITRATVKRKVGVEQPVGSFFQETVPNPKRKKIETRKPGEPFKKDAKNPTPVRESSAKPPSKVKFWEPEAPKKPVKKETRLFAPSVLKRPLTNAKAELGAAPGKIHGPAASTTRPHRSRTRTPKLAPLPALGAELKKSWEANISAGGYSFPPEWDPKANYRDGHVFSNGTFIEDGQLCKPLAAAKPRKPTQPFHPVARPKSNFATYEALFGGKGLSGLKGTRVPTAAGKHKDVLPKDLDDKLRGNLGLGYGMDDTALSSTRNKSNSSTALDDVVARANSASEGLTQGDMDRAMRIAAGRRRRHHAMRIAAERRRRQQATRSRVDAVSGKPSSASASGRRPRADAVSGNRDPLAGLLEDVETRAARQRAVQSPAKEEGKESPFARVTDVTVGKRKKRPLLEEAAEPWSELKTKQVQEYMRRQLAPPPPSERNMSPQERRKLRRATELDAQLRKEEAEAVREEKVVAMRRWRAMAKAASGRRIRKTLERRAMLKERRRRAAKGVSVEEEGDLVGAVDGGAGNPVDSDVEMIDVADEVGVAYEEDVEEYDDDDDEDEDEEDDDDEDDDEDDDGDDDDDEDDDEDGMSYGEDVEDREDPDWDETEM